MKLSITTSLLALAVSGAFAGAFNNLAAHKLTNHARHLHNPLKHRDLPTKLSHCAAVSVSLAALTPTSTSVKPTPTPPPPPPPPPAPKPKPAPPPSNNGGGGGTHNGGDVTFYTPGENACGGYDAYDSFIGAIAYGTWNNQPGWNGDSNDNPLCGKMISVCCDGKCVTVKITDLCAGCNIAASVDLSPLAFQQLADPSVGRIHDCSWSEV